MDIVEQEQQASTKEIVQEADMEEVTPEETALAEEQSEHVSHEEEEAQATLNALEKLPEIMEKLEQDNTQYDLHIQLITLLKQLQLDDQLEAARLAMHDIYPMSEALWLDWIQDAKKHADTVEGQTKLLQLYDQAEQDYLSVAIWRDYVDYILSKFRTDLPEDIIEQDETVEEFVDQTRQDLLKAVRATSSHVKRSQEIWRPYADFELSILERFKDQDQLQRVRKMYLDRLAVLHIDCEDTFNGYSSFVTNYDNANYEKNMVEANKIYAKTKKAAEERDVYELQLVSSGYALDSFYQYIEHEKTTKNMFSLNHVRSLYERAIVVYCTDPTLWDDYILFLIERARVQAFLETTCLRAIRNCPWSGTLWAHLARLLESGNKSDEQIDDIFDRALLSKPLLSSLDDLVTILLAKCDYKRRCIDWEDVDEDAVMDLRVTFEECLEYISEAFPKSGDPYYRIEKYYAYISLNRLGDSDKARDIWQSVVDSHGVDTEAWIPYILFERDQGNYQKCSSLFKQAIQKKIDNPARLIDVWTTVEHEIGTLESYEQALVKINRKTKTLTRQWQSQYAAHEEEKVSKSKEKKEMDRKKKSAHRIAQKQRAKEKRQDNNQDDFKQPMENTFKKPEITKSEFKKLMEDTFNEPESKPITESLEKDQEQKAKPDALSLKRKLSTDDLNEEESKRPKGNEIVEEQKEPRPIASFKPRPRSVRPNTRRGKSVKLPQRSVSRSDVAENATASVQIDSPENQETSAKSNDDFRAMLLNSKNKQ